MRFKRERIRKTLPMMFLMANLSGCRKIEI